MSWSSRNQWTYVRETVSTVSPTCRATAQSAERMPSGAWSLRWRRSSTATRPGTVIVRAAAPHERTEHLWDEPPDGPPVGHGSTLASCTRGRTSTPQYLAAGLRAAISKARSRLSQSTIVKLPRYSLASA